MKNAAAQQLGRLGGLARSEAKAAANRAKASAFWEHVRSGKAPAPRRGKKRAKRSPNAGGEGRGAIARMLGNERKQNQKEGATYPRPMVD